MFINTALLFIYQCITKGIQCSSAFQLFTLAYYQGGDSKNSPFGRASIYHLMICWQVYPNAPKQYKVSL